MPEGQTFTAYENQRNEYLKNGYELLELGEYRKASEMFWGAVTQTIKALAILYDKKFSSHWEIGKFIEEVARETHDQELVGLFDTMQIFHRNFYDEKLDYEGVKLRLESLKKILKKLDSLAEQRRSELLKRHNSEL